MIKYKVIGKNDINNPQDCILKNRGIQDIEYYKNLDNTCLVPYSNLDNIGKAVQMFVEHINKGSKIALLVDCDADGYTSAAMIYNYIKRISPITEIRYVLHTGKQHGLSEDFKFPYKPDICGDENNDGMCLYKNTLLIIPDAGTNDTEQCGLLKEMGIDILILDHHIQDKNNPYAVIVNNQISKNYSNKEFCGAGVVYKFLQAVDEELWSDYADDYLDLVALGNISDVMDIRSFETKYLIEKGLQSIKNKCFYAFIKGQEYSIGNYLNINAIAFYITPLINAMCRVGDSEEKDILFRAFIETDEIFKYKKRGETNETNEMIYERAVRLCKNAKTRQDNTVKKILPSIKDEINNKSTYTSPIMFVKCPVDLSSSFTGLTAIKLADYYRKPCLILRKHENGVYSGSARNFDNSPIEKLKTEILKTNAFEFCQGHEGAFGFQIKSENVKTAIQNCNILFKNIDFSEIPVDFEIDSTDFDLKFIRDIDNMKDYYGIGIKPPLVVIKNIVLERHQGVIQGKLENTWKFITDNNIAFIRFSNGENDPVLKWLKIDNGTFTMVINAICKVGINVYNGIATPQAEIKEYEVI